MRDFSHNYADDNKLSASSTYVILLMVLLSQESNTAINWLLLNRMIAHFKKFQTTFATKRNLQNNAVALSNTVAL